MVALLGIFHVFALDVFRLIVVLIIVYDYSELVKLVEAAVCVFFASPLLVVTFCPFLDLVVINELVGDMRIDAWMILIIQYIFERILRFLLLCMVLLRIVV